MPISHTTLDRRHFWTVLALLLWCALLIICRMHFSGTGYYRFLGWNLFLALVPLLFSRAMRWLDRRGGSVVLLLLLFAGWLLFLPNAPYVTTDLLHLGPKAPVPLWYDLALLLSCAGTALGLGYLSLIDVHSVVAGRLGERTGWIVAIVSLFLCGFGIYLGRYERWNSWEIVTRPRSLLSDILDMVVHPHAHLRTWAVTVLFGVGLSLGYALLRAMQNVPNIPERRKLA